MLLARPGPDEDIRIETLRQYAVLDTLPEKALDDLTALAAQICETPIALISLVDVHRQWFKSRVGFDLTETPRNISFCGHALHQRELLVVGDAVKDERFADNPMVTGFPQVRFYAGAPLINPENTALGTLCVMDYVPRTLTELQKQTLRVLALQVMTHLELRRHTRKLVESESTFHLLADHITDVLWIASPDLEKMYYVSPGYERTWGRQPSEIYADPHQWVEAILPEQRAHVMEVFGGLMKGEPSVSVEYQIARPDGAIRWVHDRGFQVRDAAGALIRLTGIAADVTNRKESELALLREAAIVASSDDGIIGKDLNGVITNWNRGAEKIFGYTAGEIVGTSIMRLIPEDRHNEEEQILSKIRSGESVEHFETLRLTKNGRLINVSVTVSPIKDATGKVVGVSKVARDITERKKAEEAKRTTDARYKTLFEYAPDGIVIADSDSRYIDANSSMCRMLGYERSEIVGMHASDIVVSSEIPQIDSALDAIKSTGDHHREWEFRRKDGSVFDADVIATEMPDGNLLGLIRDISDRKLAEERIAEQAALLDKARDAILVRDLSGKILFWNSGAERIYGWTRSEVLGQFVGGLIYGDERKFKELNDLLIGRGEWNGEIQHLTRDKREINVEARWTLIRDKDGNPKSVLAINTDVTEKKKIEAQYMRAQRMESIGTLASGIAHDLNNILAPIMMSIDILKSTNESPQARKILETIEVSAKRGADIVGQVLSFARGLEGERVEVQPRHLLKDVQSIIRDTFPKDIRLHFSIPGDTWTAMADPTQVHQILLNLCVNARDAMPGGGELSVSAENSTVDEQYAAMNIEARAGRYVCFVVTDSGTGIPRNVIGKVFEPFFTTKGIGKGTGLGLSTVMAIAKSHGGFASVYSEIGKGTTFKVYLPATETASTKKSQPVQMALPRGNGETILVVDDEASILTVTSQTLEAFGYRALIATDGADALAVYVQRRNEIAVVITDMMMPIMDGAATIQALRRINPTVKIVAASGLASNPGLSGGPDADYFLTKPYTAVTLLNAIRATLRGK